MEEIFEKKLYSSNIILKINDYNFIMSSINKKNNFIKNLSSVYDNFVKNKQINIYEIPDLALAFTDIIIKEDIDDDLNVDLILNFILKSLINREQLNISPLEMVYVDKLINSSILLLKKNIEHKNNQYCSFWL